MDNTPSEYIGIEAPSTDPNESARELFGLDATPTSRNKQHQQQCNGSGSSDSPLFPLYTPMTPYYGALYGYPLSIPGSSPSPIVGISPPSPFMPQYLPPQYLHYVPSDMPGVFYGAPTIGNQMMFGMGYNAPRLMDRDNIDQEVYENSSNDKNLRVAENNNTPRVRQKRSPSTPTSHYGRGNGHAQKRLCLDDCEENTGLPPAQLTDTEGHEVDVDIIVQELIKQNQEANNKNEGAYDVCSAVTVHGLSSHEKDQLEQIAGVFDLENLLKSGMCSLNTSPSMHSPAEETATDRAQFNHGGDMRSSIVSPHSPFELSGHSINGTLHCNLQAHNSRINPNSPLTTEEIIVETYQG